MQKVNHSILPKQHKRKKSIISTAVHNYGFTTSGVYTKQDIKEREMLENKRRREKRKEELENIRDILIQIDRYWPNISEKERRETLLEQLSFEEWQRENPPNHFVILEGTCGYDEYYVHGDIYKYETKSNELENSNNKLRHKVK